MKDDWRKVVGGVGTGERLLEADHRRPGVGRCHVQGVETGKRLSPACRRAALDHLVVAFGASQRHAFVVVGQPRSTRRLTPGLVPDAEKYHGLDSCRYLFTAVIDYLYGRRALLIDPYHPLTSDYVKRSPRIVPPLEKNRLKSS